MKMRCLNYLFLFIISSITVSFLIYYYIKNESFLYFWDYCNYESIWVNLSEAFSKSLSTGVKELFRSLKNDDYNSLAILVIVPFYCLKNLVEQRFLFICSVAILYLVPLILLVANFVSKVVNKKSFLLFYCSTLLTLEFTPFWGAILRGYPDLAGLLPIIYLLNELNKTDLTILNLKKSILVGVMLWLPFALRRWYAFTIVSIYITLPLLIYYLKNEFISKVNLQDIKNIFKNILISGGVSTLLLFVFQNELALRIIRTNYNLIYSGYNFGFKYSVKTLLNQIGYYIILADIVLLFLIYKISSKKIKVYILFFLLNLVISSLLFFHNQTAGIHHIIPFAFWIYMIFSLLFFSLISKIKYFIVQYLFPLFMILCFSFIFFNTFLNFDKINNNKISYLFPDKVLPLKTHNLSEYSRLIRDINSLPPNEKVNIFASSSNLNESMLYQNYEAIRSRIKFISQVDLRDGFNPSIFLAKYAVVADPVQLHLSPSSQSVISIPSNEILNGSTIGKSYKKIKGPYILSDGSKAFLYKKISNFNSKQIDDFTKLLALSHKTWSTFVLSDYFKRVLSFGPNSLGDIYGTVDSYFGADASLNNLIFFAHPGAVSPTTVSFLSYNLKTIKFYATNFSCNINDSILINIKGDKWSKKYELRKNNPIEITLEPSENITISFSKNRSCACDSVSFNL